MNTIFLSFLHLLSSTLVFSQYSTPISVYSVDHGSDDHDENGDYIYGKYFNFMAAEVDAIFQRTDWDNHVFMIRLERDSGMKHLPVRLWRSAGGSIGDAHGWREDRHEPEQWLRGDLISFDMGDGWRQYSHAIGNEAWYYAWGAYCEKQVIESWTWGLNDGPSTTTQFRTLKVIQTPDETLQSYVGFDYANSRVLISVRGTYNLNNWFRVNGNFPTMTYPNAEPRDNLRVFSGFYEAWKKLESAGLGQAIIDALGISDYKRVFFTGHSMGAAVASIAAMDFKLAPPYEAWNNLRVDMVTFGSPRWCNKEMAQLFNDIIHSNWRIVNRYDTVVTIPIKLQGYYHVGTEVWYNWQRWWWNMNAISYKICDGSGEDPKCFGTNYSPTKADLSIANHHRHYFGLNSTKLCAAKPPTSTFDYRFIGCFKENPFRTATLRAFPTNTRPAMEVDLGNPFDVKECYKQCARREMRMFAMQGSFNQPRDRCLCSSSLSHARRYGLSKDCKGYLDMEVYQINWHDIELTPVPTTAVVMNEFDETEGGKRRLSGKRLLDLHV